MRGPRDRSGPDYVANYEAGMRREPPGGTPCELCGMWFRGAEDMVESYMALDRAPQVLLDHEDFLVPRAAAKELLKGGNFAHGGLRAVCPECRAKPEMEAFLIPKRLGKRWVVSCSYCEDDGVSYYTEAEADAAISAHLRQFREPHKHRPAAVVHDEWRPDL